MTAAAYDHGDLPERRVPAGARRLGVKVKPVLRLGMGYRHPEKGYPVKTDYFTVRGENGRALAKFQAEYGDQPKAVDITLRPELSESVDIRYRAFGGGQHDGGGMIKAVGHTNFALRDYMGGPDLLTVWNPDGTVEELEIEGKDDPRAQELGVELAMTFEFGLPKVLSYGTVAAISSRGSETIDTVWAKLREWHMLAAWLQAPVSRVTGQPQLVLKPSTMMAPKITGKGENAKRSGWTKAQVWVLDLVLAETQDEMVARVMLERQRTLESGGATAMLYGGGRPPVRELGPGPSSPDDFDDEGYEPVVGEVVDGDGDAGQGAPAADGSGGPAADPGSGAPSLFDDDDPPAGGGEPAEPLPFKPPAAAVKKAAAAKPPEGTIEGAGADLTLGEILEKGARGEAWIEWALGEDVWPDDFKANLELFAQAKAPEIWRKVRG